MYRSVKVLAPVLALVLLVSLLSGCDLNRVLTGQTPVEGSVQTWGNISVFVPKGMTLSGGSLTNHYDPDALMLQLDENQMHYFLVTVMDREDAEDSVKITKEMNTDAADITVKIGDANWTGVTYKFAGTSDCFELWTPMGEKVALVQAAWYTCDSAEAKAVLESIKLS